MAAMAAPELRTATLDDWDGFRAVYESISAEGRWIGGELPIDWDARRPTWEASLTDPQSLIVLAWVDGVPVGWISGGQAPHGRVELGMGILDGYRSQGIGTMLLATVIGWAKQRGAHKVTLELWPHNDRALGLYEKFGFVVEGRFRRHWRRNDGSIWDSVAMGLVLDEDAPGSPFDADGAEAG
jgi:RimJ/RimL family protein N-acetyltransferase